MKPRMFSFKEMWAHVRQNKKSSAIEEKGQAEINVPKPENHTPHIPPQPSKNSSWVLTLGESQDCIANPSWETVEANLHQLSQDEENFLILEQTASQNPKSVWFLQCAIAIMGPHQGQYVVEIGFNTADAHYLWEHIVSDMQTVITYFSAAYHYRNIKMSEFREIDLYISNIR